MTTPITDTLRIATAQLNPTVGDIAGNVQKIRAARAAAAAQGADLVVTPELSIVGYPPEDLVLKPAFVADAMAAAEDLARDTADGPALIVGCPWRPEGDDDPKPVNAVLLLDQGRVHAARFKRALPNYGVFDEKRVFRPGPPTEVAEMRGLRLGLPVCEDIWFPDVPRALMAAGAELLVCINGSPWRRTIQPERESAFRAWFGAGEVPLVFVNQVGGQDELVFDGASFSWDRTGLVQQLPAFATELDVATWRRASDGVWTCAEAARVARLETDETVYRAALVAVRDYVEKNGFPGVVLGLSGGIDSALTAAMAVDALGPERVWCVMLPSRYTSQESLDDAAHCARLLGARLDTIPIEAAVGAFGGMLDGHVQTPGGAVAQENIQSRIRGTALMALSNAHGHMLLTTGNKSEMAVGYATLYGDMNGGYNALKDLYKTEVFALARWRNAHRPDGLKGPGGAVIPERVIAKAPSAELRADQTDQDSLPPYDVLDDILRGLVDREEEVEAVVARGHDPATVARIQNLLYRAEYKRRQAPPGAKIGGKNFGRDRRYPLTNGYRDHIDV